MADASLDGATLDVLRLAPERGAIDPVGLPWLVFVRWITLGAGVAALVLGRSGLGAEPSISGPVVLLSLAAVSNLWLTWKTRDRERPRYLATAAGLLISSDVVLLSWLLLISGGVLNPASVLYLVQIVVVALVLGALWTGVVTALAVGGYAVLFVAPTDELYAAQTMHPEIALHMRGMWLAFAATALVVGVLVTRLAMAVERRDRALAAYRDREARAARFAGLATLAAGAAHELGTPLSTIAVAASELERGLVDGRGDSTLVDDARLIRRELDRCRRLIDDMAGRAATPAGGGPRPTTVPSVVDEAVNRLRPADRARVDVEGFDVVPVVWPSGVVAHAVANVLQNGLQASGELGHVRVFARRENGSIRLDVVDSGSGMTPEEVARAGEPFYTSKPPGVGMGLGLFVARSSIEQLGGRLTLASTPGRGTTATIRLPANVVVPAVTS